MSFQLRKRTFLDVMKRLHVYLESVHGYRIRKNPCGETQVALRPWVIPGNIFNTDWDEREGGNEKASVTPKTPSTNRSMAKASTSMDQSCCREAELEPGLEQPPRAWVPEDSPEGDPGNTPQK